VERVVLVHGSVVAGAATWGGVEPALAGRWDVVVVQRPGFPPLPPLPPEERVDFESDAVLVAGELGDGAHLVGHSYGGVISLLAAARRPDAVRSLTVIEPPAMDVARGTPAVDAFVERGEQLWREGPTDDPDAFLRSFLRAVGSRFEPPSPLPPELEQGARALIGERLPWEARFPLDDLAAARFPKLVVSGAHHPAFDAVCDVLERRLRAERLVLRGAGHSVQRASGFVEALDDFLSRAALS
jgi:pimeloyl-ACP methyl ester carboxylesterase